jgi:hypothetical protein
MSFPHTAISLTSDSHSALSHYSNPELIAKTRALVAEETRITADVIAHLEEVDRRRAYLPAETSLHDFCVKVLGYSSDSAYRRVAAMRVIRDLPELKPALGGGELKLTTLTQVKKFLNHKKKKGQRYSPEEKQELVTSLMGLSTRESERALAALAPEMAKEDRARPISETQTEIRFVAEAKLLEDLKRIRDLWGHQLAPGASYSELLQKMADLVLAKVDPRVDPKVDPMMKRKGRVLKHREAEKPRGTKKAARPIPWPTLLPKSAAPQMDPIGYWGDVPIDFSDMPENTPENRHIPAPVRRQVWRRDGGQCTWMEPRRGGPGHATPASPTPTASKRCESKHALEIDHLDPYAHGGSHAPANLRLLCRAHHLYKSKNPGIYGSGAK